MEVKKNISMFLELETIYGSINNENIIVFLNQLEVLRKKFDADFIDISILTSVNNEEKTKEILELISNNLDSLRDVININVHFNNKDINNYNADKIDVKEIISNISKTEEFEKHFTTHNETNPQLLIIIDADISNKIYKKYKNDYPILQCYPSALKDKLTKIIL